MRPVNEIAQLIDGAQAFGIPLTEGDAQKLLRLLDELARWNRAYNLTAITDRSEAITHHLLDSLSAHPYLRGATVADVGTGAGFPGLPLALVNPGKQFSLVDSNQKKVRFVGHAARALELKNVIPCHARVELLQPRQPFDTVITRAFAPLAEMLEQISPLCDSSTRVVAMKGRRVEEELVALPSGWRVVEASPVTVPSLAEARVMVLVERHNPGVET